MSALFDFAEGVTNYRLGQIKEQETLARDGAEWERRQKFIAELQRQMERSKVARTVVNPDTGMEELYNSEGALIGPGRKLPKAELEAMRREEAKAAADARRAEAQAAQEEFQAQNAPMLMQEQLANQRASRGYTGALMADMQRRAANEEADRKLYMEQFGQPRPPSGRAASGGADSLGNPSAIALGEVEGQYAAISRALANMPDLPDNVAQEGAALEEAIEEARAKGDLPTAARLAAAYVARYGPLLETNRRQ